MYYFIVNPNSRSGQGQAIWFRLRAILTARRVPYRAYLTEYAGHAKKLAAKISLLGSQEEPVCLIAVGGDGTIHEVLTGITELDRVVFGFIPTGSGNDFCRGMKLPAAPEKALLAVLKKARIQAMDVPYIVTDNRTWRFGISTGMGFDAAVCQGVQASAFKKYLNVLRLGKLIYVFTALRQILFLSPSPVTLCMDGNRRYHFPNVYFATVMNQKYEGGGFCFCPQARPYDGILDVIVIEKMPKLKLLLCLPTAFFGKHIHFRGVHIFRCKKVQINSALPLALHIDGEIRGIRRQLQAGLEQKPLRILMPEKR